MYLHTKNRYIVVKVQDLKQFFINPYTSTIERAIIIKSQNKPQIDKITKANGKQNKPITIASMITIKANGINRIELSMKAITKQIAHKITNVQSIKKSVIFLIFSFYVFAKKEHYKPQEYSRQICYQIFFW